MLRIFRLSPEYKLEVTPPNIMYIDIDSEQEIYEKYITKKYLRPVDYFARHLEIHVHCYNYLLLQPKTPLKQPTVSDIDIIKSVPEFNLPGTFAIGYQEYLNSLNSEPKVKVIEPLIATKPSEFLISIRSIFSEDEKLTVDQNEALLCASSYYHLKAPLRGMVFDEKSNISQDPEDVYQSINYKGHEVVPIRIGRDIEDLTRDIEMSNIKSRWELSYLRFLWYSDDKIQCKSAGWGRSIKLDITSLPQPLHCQWLIDNAAENVSETIICSSDFFGHAIVVLPRFRSALRGPYKDAIVPHINQLKDIKAKRRRGNC